MANKDAEKWDFIIKPKSGWSNIDFGEIFRYRDLILMFVKRDCYILQADYFGAIMVHYPAFG